MKLKVSNILLLLLSCLFTGVIIISIGLGSVYPPIDLVARPFICPDGKMEYTQQVYRPTPVETVTTTTWYCVEAGSGTRRELGVFPLSFYSGAVYGLVLFILGLIIMPLIGRRFTSNLQVLQNSADPEMARLRDRLGVGDEFHRASTPKASGSAVERMKELEALRDANLISGMEYEQKRAEILKEL